MDFGTTLTYVSFNLVILAIAYYFLTTKNKERMALIEAGANPDMFKSEEKYYILFVMGIITIGLALAIGFSYLLDWLFVFKNPKVIYLSMILLFGGCSLLLCFSVVLKWIRKDQ